MHCQGVSPPPLRPYSMFSAVIWRREGFQHFSDISRFLTFMVKSPQTCLSSNLQCADMQVYQLHTYTDLCQRSGLVLNDCKHTPAWNYVLSSTIWQMVRKGNCAAPESMLFFFVRAYRLYALTVGFFLPKPISLNHKKAFFTPLYD